MRKFVLVALLVPIVLSEELLMKCELTSRNINCNDQNLYKIPKTDQLRSETRMDVSYNVLEIIPNGCLKNYSSLEYLKLQSCEIKTIEVYAFQELRSIKEVDLSYNNIKSIDSNTFISNTILETVLFASNPLQTTTNKPFLYSQSIKTLDLSSCNLRSLSSYFFSGLPKLKSLNISNNILNKLPSDVFQSLIYLTEVRVNNNIWQCGTENRRLMCSIENVRREGYWICYNQERRKETINLNEICGHYIPTTSQQSAITTSFLQIQSAINQTAYSTESSTQEFESRQTTTPVPTTVSGNTSITLQSPKSVTEVETVSRKTLQEREEIESHPTVKSDSISNNRMPTESAEHILSFSIWQVVGIGIGVFIMSLVCNVPCSYYFLNKYYVKRSDIEKANQEQGHPTGSDTVSIRPELPQNTRGAQSSVPLSSSADETLEGTPLLPMNPVMENNRETEAVQDDVLNDNEDIANEIDSPEKSNTNLSSEGEES